MDPGTTTQQMLQYKLTGRQDTGRPSRHWEDGFCPEQALIADLEVDGGGDDDDDDDEQDSTSRKKRNR
jgi:hypothetical protein